MLINLSMAITDTIRAIREGAGLTQEAMAERLETTRSNYAYLESRGEKLSIEQLTGIAKALGVSLGEVLGLEGKDENRNTEKVKGLEKRVGELEELSELLRQRYKDLRNNVEMAAQDLLLPDIHYMMIQMAIEAGFLDESNSQGYVTLMNDENGDYIGFEVDDKYNPHMDFFLFEILTAGQLERLMDNLPGLYMGCMDFLGNAQAIPNEKLRQAWRDMYDGYYRRSLEPFVPDPSYIYPKAK